MAIAEAKTKEELIAEDIRGILKELMGDNYMSELTKRSMSVKDDDYSIDGDDLIFYIRSTERLLGTSILK